LLREQGGDLEAFFREARLLAKQPKTERHKRLGRLLPVARSAGPVFYDWAGWTLITSGFTTKGLSSHSPPNPKLELRRPKAKPRTLATRRLT